jgi:hypothetical protein
MITRVGCADDGVLPTAPAVVLGLVLVALGAGLYAGADAPNHDVRPDQMLLPGCGWPLPMYAGVAIGYPTNFATRLPRVRICSSRFAYDASEL